MKQKRFLPLFALGALLLATSCSSDDVVSGGSGDVATVTFTVSQSASAQSRSFSDGYTATELMCGVYSSEGTYIMEKSATFASNSLTTQISFDLAKGNSYRLAFWAQSSDSPYSVSFENNSVTYTSSSSLVANSDTYDAFYNYYETGTVTGDVSDKVTLTRPFAQINFGTDDKYQYEKATSYTLSNTKVVVSGVPTTFNLFDGSVSGTGDYTFDYAAVPDSTKETFPYSTGYFYTAMSYVFASEDQELVTATLYYSSDTEDETGEDGNTHSLTVSNAPIRRNYQTNIYGSLLTGNYGISVTKDEDESGTHKVIVNSGEELDKALSSGADTIEVTLYSDITYSDILVLNGKDVTINLNGNTLTTNYNYVYSGSSVCINGGDEDNKGECISTNYYGFYVAGSNTSLSIENAEISSTYEGYYVDGICVGSETSQGNIVSLTNVNIDASANSYDNGITVWGEATVTIDNSSIKGANFGLTQQGTPPGAGSKFTITNTTITSNNVGIYLSNYSTGSTNVLSMDNCTVSAEDPIEVKKTDITVKNSTLVSDVEEQRYFVYGSGAAGEGYGIVLAGYAEGTAYEGEITLENITYTLSATSVYADSSLDPIYVNYYNGSKDYLKEETLTNGTTSVTAHYYHNAYENSGANSSSTIGGTTSE